MKTLILGGGIAGLSLACFLNGNSVVFEKEKQLGGLGRSFQLNNIFYDVGPHIIFSKNQLVLNFHRSLIETRLITRSNKIFHNGKLVKYPFENDLAALGETERDYCLQEFLNNPYENYPAENMLQFFLKTFGEGITKLYLQPYNEKIWKFDPALMDTQMVERIPKPPREDVIKSARGVVTEGYTHQLHFSYPVRGGFQSLVDAYSQRARNKAEIVHPVMIEKIMNQNGCWQVYTDRGVFSGDALVNCMPLPELFKHLTAPAEIKTAVNDLKYNSMYIVVVQVKKDALGDNFSITIADRNILFHRLSKLNFLGDNYCLSHGGSTLLMEITFRPKSDLSTWPEQKVKDRVVSDLTRLNFISEEDVTAIELRRFEYAYVIYDLYHKQNSSRVLSYLSSLGIYSCGRFAEFEYMNSDLVVEKSQKLAELLNALTVK